VDGDEEYCYEVPQIQDEVAWQRGTNSVDLSTSETREGRQTWNLKREHPWSKVPPNIRKAESRSHEWSDPPFWLPGEPGTTGSPEQHRSVRTYDLGLTTTLWMRLNGRLTDEWEWRPIT